MRHKLTCTCDIIFLNSVSTKIKCLFVVARFANGEFEQNAYENRIHDVVTHTTSQRAESVLEYVNITGAGILHNEKSPAVQSVVRSPAVSNVNISRCASHGINLVSPSETTRLLFNRYYSTYFKTRWFLFNGYYVQHLFQDTLASIQQVLRTALISRDVGRWRIVPHPNRS